MFYRVLYKYITPSISLSDALLCTQRSMEFAQQNITKQKSTTSVTFVSGFRLGKEVWHSAHFQSAPRLNIYVQDYLSWSSEIRGN